MAELEAGEMQGSAAAAAEWSRAVGGACKGGAAARDTCPVAGEEDAGPTQGVVPAAATGANIVVAARV